MITVVRIQNTTFEKEHGEILQYTEKYVVVRLFHSANSNFPEDTSFTRKFSRKTGKAFGCNLKINL